MAKDQVATKRIESNGRLPQKALPGPDPTRERRRAPDRIGPEALGLALAEQAPRMSATTCPPTGFPRSTLGDGGLSCRVRNGSGRSPPPWSRSCGALPHVRAIFTLSARRSLAPWGLHAPCDPESTTLDMMYEELGLLVLLA